MPETLVGGRQEHYSRRSGLGKQGGEKVMVASKNVKEVTDLGPRVFGGGGQELE